MGSSCNCQSNNSAIQPIISFAKPKSEQNFETQDDQQHAKFKALKAYSTKNNESVETLQIGKQNHQNNKVAFKKHQVNSNSLIDSEDHALKGQKDMENQQGNQKRHGRSIDFYMSQKREQSIQKVDDVIDRGCIVQRIIYMERNSFIDPKTNRIVPYLRPLKNNDLYKKRLTSEEELETDVSMKLKV